MQMEILTKVTWGIHTTAAAEVTAPILHHNGFNRFHEVVLQ